MSLTSIAKNYCCLLVDEPLANRGKLPENCIEISTAMLAIFLTGIIRIDGGSKEALLQETFKTITDKVEQILNGENNHGLHS